MKKKKIWVIITAIVLIFVAIAIGIIEYKIGENPNKDLLTLKTIRKTLEKQGVAIKKNKSISPNAFELNGVRPTIFSVDKEKGTLLVYIFKSIGERKDIVSNSDKDDPFNLFEIPFKTKNAFLIYKPSVPENPTLEEWNNLAEPMDLISDIVFKYFNNGKEVVFKGESNSWIGTFTLKYYDYFWQDEKGTLKHEGYHDKLPEIQYKLEDIVAVGPIEYEYKTTSSSGSGRNEGLNKDGYLTLGHGGGNGALPSLDKDIPFIIKWNGKEETIILKAQ